MRHKYPNIAGTIFLFLQYPIHSPLRSVQVVVNCLLICYIYPLAREQCCLLVSVKCHPDAPWNDATSIWHMTCMKTTTLPCNKLDNTQHILPCLSIGDLSTVFEITARFLFLSLLHWSMAWDWASLHAQPSLWYDYEAYSLKLRNLVMLWLPLRPSVLQSFSRLSTAACSPFELETRKVYIAGGDASVTAKRTTSLYVA